VGNRLGSFEIIEGGPPNGQDINGIVNGEVSNAEIDESVDPFNLFPLRPDEANAIDGLFHQVQGIEENRRQGLAAERSESDYIKRVDPEAKLVKGVRVYVAGGPEYMVADIFFRGNGTAAIHLLEVKSGDAKLSPRQLLALAEAAKTGNIYIVNPEAAAELEIQTHITFGAQHILPLVSVIGGDQEAIRKQMRSVGLDVISEGGGRGSHPPRLRFGVRPN
jgi:hypothetical protein